LYYQDAQPIISDSEWDELFVYLKKIEANYPTIISTLSPTQNLDMQSGTVSE